MKKLLWLVGIAVMLVVALASPNLINAQAVFEVSDLVISPSQINKGESASISVTVKNTGDASGSYALELKIDGEVEATEKVELEAEASKTETFTVTKDAPGEYSVEIADLKGLLMVTAAAFHVTDLVFSPKQVNQGEPIKISVDVANVGSEQGNYTLWLKLRKEVTLDAKVSQTVDFTIIGDTVGEHQLEIADLEGEFRVVSGLPPSPAPPPSPALPPSPWWRNWWFIGGIAGAVVIIVLAVIIIRYRRA